MALREVGRAPFLDTNIFVRHVTGDEPDQARRATALFTSIGAGSTAVASSATAVFEAVFVLEKTYELPRWEITRALAPLLHLSGIEIPDKQDIIEAFEIYANYSRLSFADCYHAVLSIRHCGGEIYSFDRGFDGVQGISRIVPN